MTLQRAGLLAMALGLFMIVQPWREWLFAAGFPVTLAGIALYNAAGWFSGSRAEKARIEAERIPESTRPDLMRPEFFRPEPFRPDPSAPEERPR